MPGGILFAATGAAFSTDIALVLRGRRLSELSWIRCGLGGGVVSFRVLRALRGDDRLALTKLLGTGALGFVFGGVAATGTLKLAHPAGQSLRQRSAREPELPADALPPYR